MSSSQHSPRSQGVSSSSGDDSHFSEKELVQPSTLETARDRHASIQPIDQPVRADRAVHGEEGSQKTRLPLGLSTIVFALLIAGITAIIVGAIVGGAVAGTLKHSPPVAAPVTTTVRIAPTTVTATKTTASTITAAYDGMSIPSPSSLYNYTVPEAYYIGSLKSPCPWTSSNAYEASNGDQYVIDCNIDMNTGLADEKFPTRKVVDIVSIFAYSFEDCLLACSHANNMAYNSGGAFPKCEGVGFGWAMASYNTSAGANCWLKNGTSTGIACDSCMSAKLK